MAQAKHSIHQFDHHPKRHYSVPNGATDNSATDADGDHDGGNA